MKIFRISAVLVLLAQSSCFRTNPPSEILWDSWGVPHIYSHNKRDLFKAFGWAQMHQHGNLLLKLYAEARGRSAEYFGRQYLDQDRLTRSFQIPQRSDEWYQKQSPEFRSYIDAFVEGINSYASSFPEAITEESRPVLPVRSTDVLGRLISIFLKFTLRGPCGSAVRLAHPHYPTLGSNGWAISSSYSESSHSLLLANPHLPWMETFTWFEAQLSAKPADANSYIYGAAMVGLPVLQIAFNSQLGWTHTVNTIPTCEAFELVNYDQDRYLFDSKPKKFAQSIEEIHVKGEKRSVQHWVKKSVYGPVFSRNGRNVSVRIPALGDFPTYGALEQWWDMGNSRDFSDFEGALRRLQLPLLNVIYADRKGNSFFLHGGIALDRSGYDFRTYMERIGKGDSSRTLPTRVRPYEDLPRIFNPLSGWVQNSNSPPWYITFPHPPQRQSFPADISSLVDDTMSLRDQRSVAMVSQTKSGKMSFEEMRAALNSTEVELAHRILPDLFLEASDKEYRHDRELQEAVQILESWNRNADADSRGMALFYEWYGHLIKQVGSPKEIFSVDFNPKHPLSTPEGILRRDLAIAALKQASRSLRSRGFSLDVAWGDFYQMKYGKRTFPISGGPGDPFGIFRAIGIMPELKSEHGNPLVHGSGYMALIEFSDPVRAEVLLTYGNSSEPSSPHFGDQLPLFTHKKLRAAWIHRQQIETHLEKKTEIK